MSVETDSDTNTIYVELLDEGTFVIRPTQAQCISETKFKLLPTDDYDPELEKWMFVPGSIVECDWEEHESEQLLVAKRQII